jgi:hypothetical protein
MQKNNRLPGVPSANEVMSEGLVLGSNQATLLQKIEVLTLYLIQENKNNKELNHKFEEQDKRINRLEELLKIKTSSSYNY